MDILDNSSAGTSPLPLAIPGRGSLAPPLYDALPLAAGGPAAGAGAGAADGGC